MIPTELRHTLTAAKQIYLGQAVLLAATLGRDQAASLFMPWTRTDPYPVYEKIRARGQFASSRLGVQMVTSHRLSGQVLRSRDFSVVDPTGAINPRGTGDEVDLSLLIIDPPDHTRLRRVVAPAFSPRRLAQFETLIASTVADLLGKLPRGEPFDLIEHYAAVLPMRVIAELLGIPEQDRGRFRDWGQAIARALDGYSSLAHRRRLLRGQEELAAMFERLFEQRRHQPTDDAISDLVQAGDTIHPDEMVPLCTLLLVAGFETTVNLIGSTVIHLHRAGQWDLLTDDPALAQAATEETLRFDPPVQMTARWALSDVEVSGHRVPFGTVVLPMIGATGRDPEVFTRPGVYDLTRTQEAETLAFSAGVHYCLGAPLARMEARIGIAELVKAAPTLRPAGPLTYRATTTLRGPRTLPVII
ncbi:MAG: cytochrome P450 [Actinomycetales bacterium]